MKHLKASIKLIDTEERVGMGVFLDGSGKLVMTLTEETEYSDLYLDGDQVIYHPKNSVCPVRNLSCLVLRVSRFRRNLNSILRNMINKDHPLNRVLVLNNKKNYWCIPHDQHLRHRTFRIDSVLETNAPEIR